MDLKQGDPEIHSFSEENEKRMNKVAIPLRMVRENKEHSTFSSTKEKVSSQAENPSVHHYYIFTNLV